MTKMRLLSVDAGENTNRQSIYHTEEKGGINTKG